MQAVDMTIPTIGFLPDTGQGSAESQMQQEDTTHARQKRRSDKEMLLGLRD